MKMKYKGVIFDLDGTLVDTIADIAVSMNHALALYGFPQHPVAEYRAKVGWGLTRLAFQCLPIQAQNDENAALLVSAVHHFYAKSPVVHAELFPGILELTAELSQKHKLFVLTNKPDPAAQEVVSALFPEGTFVCVRGELRGKPRKPDPTCVWDMLVEFNLAPSDVIFAGDSEVDIQTALAAGSFPLGVSWGYRPRSTLEEAGARRIIDAPEELLDFFR